MKAKTGRPKAIQTPNELEKLFGEYKQHVFDNPITQQDFVGKDALQVVRKYTGPFTWQGFEVFLYKEGVIHNLEAYKANENESYTEFRAIIRVIGNEIYNNKFSGAAVNVFNANIIARDLGLIDKQDIKNNAPQSVIIMSSSPEEEKANQKTLDDIDKN